MKQYDISKEEFGIIILEDGFIESLGAGESIEDGLMRIVDKYYPDLKAKMINFGSVGNLLALLALGNNVVFVKANVLDDPCGRLYLPPKENAKQIEVIKNIRNELIENYTKGYRYDASDKGFVCTDIYFNISNYLKKLFPDLIQTGRWESPRIH